jgi:hypothetical protein
MYITIYIATNQKFRTGERSRGGEQLTLVLPLRVEAVGWR